MPLIGATAVALLKAGADTDKRDSDGLLALELAPDKEVSSSQYCPRYDGRTRLKL